MFWLTLSSAEQETKRTALSDVCFYGRRLETSCQPVGRTGLMQMYMSTDKSIASTVREYGRGCLGGGG